MISNDFLMPMRKFLLKNKLESWNKEVRILGYKPVIYVNYAIND